MDDDKLAIEEARRAGQHSSVKSQVEGEVQAEIAEHAATTPAPESERIDAKRMALDIAEAGTRARWMESPDAIVLALAKEAQPGDVVLAMSNGGFGGLHDKLLKALGTRA